MALYAIFRHDTDFRLDLRTLGAQIGYLWRAVVRVGLGELCAMRCAGRRVRALPSSAPGLRDQATPRCNAAFLHRQSQGALGWAAPQSSGSMARRSCCACFSSSAERLLWMFSKDADNLMPLIAATFAQAGLIGLILQLLPVDNHDGSAG